MDVGARIPKTILQCCEALQREGFVFQATLCCAVLSMFNLCHISITTLQKATRGDVHDTHPQGAEPFPLCA